MLIADDDVGMVGMCDCVSVCLSIAFGSPEKRLNRSRCRLEGRLGWAQGTIH